MNDPDKRQNTLSGGEKFVAINLLGKIGTVFLIASVIAFSAASEGHIPDIVRLMLVLALGLGMLGAGELFRRKGSEVFAGTMIFGGVAELIVCAPVGRIGLHVFSNFGMIVYSIIVTAIGFGLVVRYRSQALLIMITVLMMIPASMVSTSIVSSNRAESAAAVMVLLPVFIVLTHGANAVISRRFGFNGACIVGIWTAVFEMYVVGTRARRFVQWWHESADIAPLLFMILFLICCMLCYAGGSLLNAVQDGGYLNDTDCAVLGMSQGLVLFFTSVMMIGNRAGGIVPAVMAVLYTLAVAAFAMKFYAECRANKVLINLSLISAALALLMLIKTGDLQYTALHIFAAVVLITGELIYWKLLRNWGYALLITAQLRFFIVMIESIWKPQSFKMAAMFANLILWFGVLAVLASGKTRDTDRFRAYTFAALLDAGIILSNLISTDIMGALRGSEAVSGSESHIAAFSALLCAIVWMILGFAAGKLRYLKSWKAFVSITHYCIGLLCLNHANIINRFSSANNMKISSVLAAVTIIVNVVSVLAVLDITLQVSERSSKFARAVGLIVSGYAMLTLTVILGTNDVVKFTSCIISIIYIVMAAVWIVTGFWKSNALLRRFGLALSLFSSAKLFLFDFRGVDAFGRTLLFIGFGIVLLGISFGYAVMEKRLSNRENKR